VPLLISHPSSPLQVRGSHYPYPVELIDIFPTLADLLHMAPPGPSKCMNHVNGINRCQPLQGKSLKHIISGNQFDKKTLKWKSLADDDSLAGVAVSQVWRCAKKNRLTQSRSQFNPWFDCNVDTKPQVIKKEISVMGYSFRSWEYRYNIWLPVDRSGGN
jgi:hypothetical protein